MSDSLRDLDQQPYIHEYNPDLRVNDNTDAIQFCLDNLSFKLGFGIGYYSFDRKGGITATQYVGERQDFVKNGRKIRKQTDEYVKRICRALLLSEKILGNANIDENQEINIAEVDNFLIDEETMREKLLNDVNVGLISKTRYLKKVYNMTDEEVLEEMKKIDEENNIDNLEITSEDISE